METLIIILCLIACIGIVISTVFLIKNTIKKQNNKNNKKILIGSIILLTISFIGAENLHLKDIESTNAPITKENKNDIETTIKDIEVKKDDIKINDEDDSKINNEEIKREHIIGVSDKDFKELNDTKPRKVRNDMTDNLRLITIGDNCDIKDYALSYYNENFENNSEIHAIVNFTTNTTTKISDVGNFIEVVVLQRVEKEEHDAKKLFSGMKLAHYWVYKDNGEIEKIK